MAVNIYDVFDSLCHDDFSRLGCTFVAENETYFYDSGTGKVFACDELEYRIIDQLLTTSSIDTLKTLPFSDKEIQNGLQSIYTLMLEEHILMRPIINSFSEVPNAEPYSIKEIILELTEQCNFRCRYCVFNEDFTSFRAFTNRSMSWETAKKAIDFAAKHSGEHLYIGFYGGEPLLNFPLLKQCMEYAKSTYSDRELFFSMTTNLSLVTHEIADYLSQYTNMSILCSIDGPKEIHDTYRFQLGKQGSFDKTMHGLRVLTRAFGEHAKDVLSVNTVVCPPFTEEKFNQLKAFFEDDQLFPKGMKFQYSYVSTGSLKDKDLRYSNISIDEFYKLPFQQTDPYKYISMKHMINQSDIEYEKSIEGISLIKMHRRFLHDYPVSIMPRNGCCKPGQNRLYITADGFFKLCEKIGDSPFIGSVSEGFYQDVIQEKYYQRYDDYALMKCNHCWAAHLCDVCFATCYDKYGLNPSKKENVCKSVRLMAKHNLIEYHAILARKSNVIAELDERYREK